MTTEARSLLEPFTPPDGLKGHTVVFVAMTADPDVLDAMMVRFTGLSALARARQGQRVAYLMRDAGAWDGRTDVLSPGSVPGMHELRPRIIARRWPRLLHAKLALMTFSPSGREHPTLARLLVTTGNFTRASLKHQLELAFVVDADLQDDGDTSGRADLRAAAEFVHELADLHFQSAAERASKRLSPLAGFDDLLESLVKLDTQGQGSRFFHSLHESLFEQLRVRIEREVKTGRNLLLCASGFLEQAVDEEAGPAVLEEFAKLGPVSQRARRVLMVPPETTGQLRDWASRSEASGWQSPIRAHDSTKLQRRLHAKYVLLGRTSGDEHALQSGHLYLGSGNLSRRGMTASGPADHGNVECGVFFKLGGGLSADELESWLFWNDSAPAIEPDEWIVRDPEVSPAPPPIVPCPILHALAKSDGRVTFVWSLDADAPVLVRASSEDDWLEVSPRAGKDAIRFLRISAVLHVSTLDLARTWQVPVIDEMGRYAWMVEDLLSVRALLAALQGQDSIDSEDDDLDAEDDISTGVGAKPRVDANQVERKYDLLEMATVVETIAREQQTLGPNDLELWFERLERIRDRPFADDMFRTWPTAAVDLTRPLSQPGFAPPGMSTPQRRRYLHILEGMATRWGLR